MSDAYVLILILYVFYLHDCSLWLDRDTIAFFARWTSGWQPRRPHPVLSRSSKGLLLSFRLPPLAPVYLCYPWRVSLSPTYVCPTPPPGSVVEVTLQRARHPLPYTTISSVNVADEAVKVNGQPFVTCQEPTQATALAQLLQHLASLPDSARENALRTALAATMDLNALRRDLAIFADTAALLRILCNILFLYLFLAVPILLALFSLSLLWPVLVTALGVLVLVIAVEFRDIHLWLWPAEKSARRSALARIGCYPPTAIRAHDYLAHRVCAQYSSLAVAVLLCEPPVFDRFARQVLRRLHHPLADGAADPTATATEAWFQIAQADCIRQALATCGIRTDAYLQPPSRSEMGSLTYCPRCETEYAIASGTCADCPGVALVPYESVSNATAAHAPPAAQVTP
jgi:hypothetical protein